MRCDGGLYSSCARTHADSGGSSAVAASSSSALWRHFARTSRSVTPQDSHACVECLNLCRVSDAVKFGMAMFAEMGGVRKAPRDETARRLVWLVVQGVYGDLSAA